MKVITYNEKTKKKVADYIREKGRVTKTNIIFLGGDKRKINWETLLLILDDLHKEGKILYDKKGMKGRVYVNDVTVIPMAFAVKKGDEHYGIIQNENGQRKKGE